MKMCYDGVEIQCLPDTAKCLEDEEHRSPLDLYDCPLGYDVCDSDCFGYTENENIEE